MEECRKKGICHSQNCFDGKLAVTRAQMTPPAFELSKTNPMCWISSDITSDGVSLCCSPPSRLTKEWPVNPAYLWSGAHTDKDDDVTWQWSNNFGSNNKDAKQP
jgi:hypothetical protein